MEDIQAAARSQLKDINDVVIDTSKPRDQRIADYIRQIGDPYRYIDNGIVVEIAFADTEVTLQDRLAALARSREHTLGNLWDTRSDVDNQAKKTYNRSGQCR